MQISIRPARGEAAHDPYAPGLHHLCLQLASAAAVDEAAAALEAAGISTVAPALYPEYNANYYATFFSDPDGIRLELVGRTPDRDALVEHWDELTAFVNPMAEYRTRRK